MSIQCWSQEVLLVDLPEDLARQDELQIVLRMLHNGGVCDVVVDFSQVHVVGGAWLTHLLKVQRLVHEHGHKLTLCGVAPVMRGLFTIAHLDSRFGFAEDRFAALATPQLVA